MEKEIRRPAAVDPAVLEVRPELPEACDAVMAEAVAIGRRATHKILTAFADAGWSAPETYKIVSDIIEAEVRSTWGTPTEGDMILRFHYAEAVQVLAAVVEAMDEGRTRSELGTLSELRRKLLLAIGLA